MGCVDYSGLVDDSMRISAGKVTVGRYSLVRVEFGRDNCSTRHGAQDNMAAYHFDGVV
jgi:hypothetical protein